VSVWQWFGKTEGLRAEVTQFPAERQEAIFRFHEASAGFCGPGVVVSRELLWQRTGGSVS
jgi:xanthine dehydrogenase iron-sulfur cluster and FAD-binding subunit A